MSFTTEVRENFIKPVSKKDKPSRKANYLQKAYEENARNVLINHELQEKREAQEKLISEYKVNYSQMTTILQNDCSNNINYPLYNADAIITFWSANKFVKSLTIRKQTKFSRPISEQLDQQFG